MTDYPTTQDELDIITLTRGKVMGRKEHTGVNLFLVWGYPSAFCFLAEFAALMLWDVNLCAWFWVCIPLVGAPMMLHFQHKDYDRTGHRTLDANIILQMWLILGGCSALAGFATGFAGLYEACYCVIQGLLVSLGCAMTGVISRHRHMTLSGIAGILLSFAALFIQGDLWPWQLLLTAVIVVITLIIPGHIIKNYVKRHGI